jgi:hypothetical protein
MPYGSDVFLPLSITPMMIATKKNDVSRTSLSRVMIGN